jgi:hypothetical protein
MKTPEQIRTMVKDRLTEVGDEWSEAIIEAIDYAYAEGQRNMQERARQVVVDARENGHEDLRGIRDDIAALLLDAMPAKEGV